MKPEDYCGKFLEWAALVKNNHDRFEERHHEALDLVHMMVRKSCLLDRIIYRGEGISQTPCPVHKGHWSGIDTHPGQMMRVIATGALEPIDPRHVDEHSRAAHEMGCRCWQHKCGCTTGWQPDEHCGCLTEGGML